MEQWSKSTDATRNGRLFSLVTTLALVGAVASAGRPSAAAVHSKASPYPTPYGATVPAGVDVPVALVTQINSGTFNVGDSFEFKTTKEAKLGDVDVPVGTGGHGRVASVTRATDKQNGTVAIQADSIDLADGTPIWVNVDPKTPVQGHLADKHTRFLVVSLSTDYSGNMVLEPGTSFAVMTSARRAEPAPLVTPSPDGEPAASASPEPMTKPVAAPPSHSP